MSYPKTMTAEQLGQYGFDISLDDPNRAINRLYPNLSVRHRCEKCGNWTGLINGKCGQCFVGKPALKPTRQSFKFYLGCCGEEDCEIRAEARKFLGEKGMETVWKSRDGYGEYVPLDPMMSWSEEDRNDLFEILNEFSVSKFGARLLTHPGSKAKSKLPKKPRARG